MPALQELLIDEMKDMIHAESQAVKAYPKIMRAAKNPKLKQALQKHLEETKNHVERLKQAFEMMGEKPKGKPCRAMQGLIEESLEKIEEGREKPEAISDLALVGVAQKMEHYEISAYGTARTMAEQLGNKKVARLLQQTLNEEEKTDKLLTQLSPPLLEEANHEPEEGEEEE